DRVKAYSGACKLIHVKDFRIAPLPVEVYERREETSHQEVMAVFTGLAQFAEVGQGNMNWPALLPAAEKAGAEYFLIEQDDTYGRDPYDSIRHSGSWRSRWVPAPARRRGCIPRAGPGCSRWCWPMSPTRCSTSRSAARALPVKQPVTPCCSPKRPNQPCGNGPRWTGCCIRWT